MSIPPKSPRETLRDIGEDALIARIAAWMGAPAPERKGAPPWSALETLAGIGDDTALVRSAEHAAPMALTTDMLVEGVHFLPDHPPEDLGAKALAVNLSDLAAVGAWPAWFLVSLGAPGDAPVDWIERFYQGLRATAAPYGCLCLGGDCVRASALTINIVAGGLCSPSAHPPLRSRAQPGQALYATGTLGDSGAGLWLLRAGQVGVPGSERERKDREFLLARHRRPVARVEAGAAIAVACTDAAMMDLSDGLAVDLPRLARASGCGFDVRLAALPLSGALRRFAPATGRSPTQFALLSGEDYELLFTTGAEDEEWRTQVARAAPGRPLRLTRIGKVTDQASGIRYLDAQGRALRIGEEDFRHYD